VCGSSDIVKTLISQTDRGLVSIAIPRLSQNVKNNQEPINFRDRNEDQDSGLANFFKIYFQSSIS